jgi:ABC-type glycerol-3-phosphate transport system substrate-binding protein
MVLVALALAGCGDDDSDTDTDPVPQAITVWTLEAEPDRLAATTANVAEFTAKTGIQVKLVGVPDDELAPRVQAAQQEGALPDVMQLPLASAHTMVEEGLLNISAAEEVVRTLGDETFSQTALSLVSTQGRVAAVPSDGWGQLLIYRKDVFRKAGLGTPMTLDAVLRAAKRLDGPDMAGITLATAGGDPFTAESFEHVALAAGCRLVDDRGDVQLTSPECLRAFRVYVKLARYSVGGTQDVESTRDAYFAGRAAMVFWSPFLLDAMAGLRDDAKPTCAQCRDDPAYLARNSGLVGPLASRNQPPAQFGDIATWAIPAGADVGGAQAFVRYMLSDGYLRWLELSPQGKYPVRAGDRSDPDRYFREWEDLQSGVDRKAPLREFYSAAAIASLRDGVRDFNRWGIDQGQAALVGKLRGPQPVTKALAAAIEGRISPEAAARRAQQDVQALQADGP